MYRNSKTEKHNFPSVLHYAIHRNYFSFEIVVAPIGFLALISYATTHDMIEYKQTDYKSESLEF